MISPKDMSQLDVMDPPPLSLSGTTTMTPSVSVADSHPRPLVGRNIQFPLSLPRDPPREAAHASAAVREKFQKAAQAIQASKRPRQTSLPYTGGLASEPGLDYTTIDVEGFDNPAEVTITDYCAERCSTSNRIYSLLKLEEFFKVNRPTWTKVRWINVVGLNWRFIKFLAMRYHLHRLAIEDLLSVQRTKIDTYQDHIYVCLLMHVLIGEDDRVVTEDDASESCAEPPSPSGSFPSPSAFFPKLDGLFRKRHDSNEGVPDAENATDFGDLKGRRLSLPIAQHYNPDRTLIYDHVKSSREGSLSVTMEQVSIFLTNEGTVISFFQDSGRAAVQPILQRLASSATILRTTEDPSLLLQSIIDAIVDLSFPITTAYQEVIADLEIDVLTNPKMRHTRELHIISGELSLLKRTLYPIYNMVNALRDHRPPQKKGYFHPNVATGRGGTAAGNVTTPGEYYEMKVRGTDISDAAKVYLADVADHVLILTEEVDILRGTVENMINLIFNMVAATQNETMRQLTTVTLIFLPLTFLAGYFGMNFSVDNWHVLTNNGPMYFWGIAIPTTIAITTLVAFSYLHHLWKILRRQIERKRIKVKLRKNREMRRHRSSIAISRSESMELPTESEQGQLE